MRREKEYISHILLLLVFIPVFIIKLVTVKDTIRPLGFEPKY